MGKRLNRLAAGSGLALLLLYTCACDVVERSYATYDEALSDGIVGKGRWIPFLPKSARRIRELHDMDSNYAFMRFELDLRDAEEMTAPFKRVEEKYVRFNAERAPGWWPAELRRETAQTAAGGELYDCAFTIEAPGFVSNHAAYLLLDRTAGMAYYWSFESEYTRRPVPSSQPRVTPGDGLR